MHTDKKTPAGSANYPAGNTDAGMVPETGAAGALSAEGFASLRAAFAMRGHDLRRHAGNGSGGLYAARWGLVRYLPTPDDARRFLAQIGGAE